MSFEDLKLDKRMIEILQTKGITKPTEIQKETYAMAANGHDIIGVSKTGSGKTLAFLLPVITQILKTDKPFYTLIITPTRELAQQISDGIAMFESIGVRQALLIGGEFFSAQVKALSQYPHVVVGTPGCIVKHIQKTKNFKIGSIRKLVLDEADRFFDQDFSEELGIISAALKRKNQTLMFTATLTEKTEKLSILFMRNPRVMGAVEAYEQVETLHDYCSLIPDKYKLTTLCKYLRAERNGSAIVFVSMCRDAQKISGVLNEIGITSDYLHGSMVQAAREDVLKRFRDSEFSILVSTDLAGRGLDIPHVDMIINYDLPNTAKDYMHRVGRTARAGRNGTAISFATQYDLLALQKLEHVLKRKLTEKLLGPFSEDAQVAEAYEKVSIEINEKMDKKRRRN